MSDLLQKIFDVGKDLRLINFATFTEDGKPWVRYVVGKADTELVVRFCTHMATKKVGQIRKNRMFTYLWERQIWRQQNIVDS